jgi:23S rRNA (adenine2030-N6)-methyltransferase
MPYDHRKHAGNPGDVWKHFMLAEALEHLLAKNLISYYVESHLGCPEYLLEAPGEWSGGIGRCWQNLRDLQKFCLFRTLQEVNGRALRTYLGSAGLALKLAQSHHSPITAEGWDTSPRVAAAWSSRQEMKFHQGDGFSGVRSLLNRLESAKTAMPALLLIDPPYRELGEAKRASDLLETAADAGWTVLWWQMLGEETLSDVSCNISTFSIEFEEAGMDGGDWMGATMALAGPDRDLAGQLRQNASDFIKLMR